jgi:RNA polymerase sigma factor (sigma-70 family)
MTNTETLKLFESIDMIKSDSTIVEEAKDRRIMIIQNEIIEKLGFLVYSNTKSYKKFENYEDLVQEGFTGLIKAVQHFDRNLFPNFFVYANRWIRGNVKRAASRFDVVYNPNKSRVIYAEPSEIEQEKETEYTPEDTFFAKEKSYKIDKVLNEFSHRDRDIVERIFGLGKHNPQTLRDIGPIYNITHERVRQIKNEVISKLRKNESLNELC